MTKIALSHVSLWKENINFSSFALCGKEDLWGTEPEENSLISAQLLSSLASGRVTWLSKSSTQANCLPAWPQPGYLPAWHSSVFLLEFQKNFWWRWNAHVNIPIHISLERSNLIELHSDFTGMRWEGFNCYKVRNFSDIIFCWKNIWSANGG